MERGVVSAGCDPVIERKRPPRLELGRPTIPWRVCTHSHMDVTAESVIDVCEHEEEAGGGLALTHEPAAPRFFLVRFELVAPHPAPSDTETAEHAVALEAVLAATP